MDYALRLLENIKSLFNLILNISLLSCTFMYLYAQKNIYDIFSLVYIIYSIQYRCKRILRNFNGNAIIFLWILKIS